MIRLVLLGLLACLLLGCSGSGGSRAAEQVPGPAALHEPVVRLEDVGRTLFEYRRDPEGLKPYLERLVTPSGLELLRDAPPDHEHHHGLMLALGVDDVDFWGERYAEVPGRQIALPLQSGSIRADPGLFRGWLAERVEWRDPRDDGLRLEELREVAFEPPRGDRPLQVTWWSALEVPAERERAVLWGRPYFGLGLRFAAGFDHVSRFTGSDGAEAVVVRGDERLVAARWCACSAQVDGRAVTVAMFSHPDNPRHPARFFTMAEPFAYLSATLDLAERPLELVQGEELVLGWGVAAWEREVTPAEIEQQYRDWSSRVEPMRKSLQQFQSAWRGDRP